MTQTAPVNRPSGRSCSVPACPAQAHARGMCNAHYSSARRHRQFVTRKSMNGKSLLERFWLSVNKTPSCWLWTGAATGRGYGSIGRAGGAGTIAAHRLSWKIHYGDIPDGMLVCHTCDTRLCVRPDHFFLGTPRDNVRDMHAKGRAAASILNLNEIISLRDVIDSNPSAANALPESVLVKLRSVSAPLIDNPEYGPDHE